MNPKLECEPFYFVSIDSSKSVLNNDREGEMSLLDKKAIGKFWETEGFTYIISDSVRCEVISKIQDISSISSPFAKITLSVHSDLEAVGFLSRILPPLADAGLSVNVISAFFHDHLFVPFNKGKNALEILDTLSNSTDA
jgi:hypothetical protein